MRHIALFIFAFLFVAAPAWAQGTSLDTPMNFTKKFSGDQALRFGAGGSPLSTKGTRLKYRVISNEKDYKKVWGYLYDDTVKVDFSKQRVLLIYKSPANGGFTLRPVKVYELEGKLSVEIEAAWNGKTGKSHPFLFLAVDKFKKFEATESYVSPAGKEKRLP